VEKSRRKAWREKIKNKNKNKNKLKKGEPNELHGVVRYVLAQESHKTSYFLRLKEYFDKRSPEDQDHILRLPRKSFCESRDGEGFLFRLFWSNSKGRKERRKRMNEQVFPRKKRKGKKQRNKETTKQRKEREKDKRKKGNREKDKKIEKEKERNNVGIE